ncbi:hypothetical protein P3X46_020174 [Hevea brasiliensis]|uniref:Plant bHLH transcription factor ACT-like domain-containing protein n=1 Tax=Hevea brasiliensis TaxID=3981 RepID=A0ABQ9LM95_HEVBR|nr:uncharacterized protein LOC110669098 [Hevea brasiliensis]KAJ9168678.1 hypothetical protein P3X46_020174 [Hevea brasiliensis]
MVSRLQRRIALRRKLHILRTLTCSNPGKRRSIIADAILHIYKLKLKLEKIKRELSIIDAIKREHLSLLKQVQYLPKVKVEKTGKGFLVKVICQKGGDNLVPILEVFEEMGLVVLHAKVSCNFYFGMEAIVVSEEEEQDGLDVKNVTQAVVEAIVRHVEGADRSIKVPVVN